MMVWTDQRHVLEHVIPAPAQPLQVMPFAEPLAVLIPRVSQAKLTPTQAKRL